MLLPRQKDEESLDIDDPRIDLVAQLLEYKKYKNIAHKLKNLHFENKDSFFRSSSKVVYDQSPDVSDFLNEVNNLIQALENTFIIDENLTINKSAELLWSFRDFDITKVNKITTPTDYLTLQDGRQVLVLNQSLYNFLIKESIIDS